MPTNSGGGSHNVTVDPVTAFVRGLDGDFYMVREAAEALGIKRHVLQRAIGNGTEGMVPSHAVMIGKMKVYLYTLEDVQRMKQIMEERKTIKTFDDVSSVKGKGGRPSQYNEEERRQRARLYSRACYWKKRIVLAQERGDDELLRQATAMVDQIEEEITESTKR